MRSKESLSGSFYDAHYSKIQIFVQKFNFDKTPNIFTSFSPKFFWQFFSWNQSCQQLESPKPQHFRDFFTQKKSTIISGNQSWIFGQKMKISNSVDELPVEEQSNKLIDVNF